MHSDKPPHLYISKEQRAGLKVNRPADVYYGLTYSVTPVSVLLPQYCMYYCLQKNQQIPEAHQIHPTINSIKYIIYILDVIGCIKKLLIMPLFAHTHTHKHKHHTDARIWLNIVERERERGLEIGLVI